MSKYIISFVVLFLALSSVSTLHAANTPASLVDEFIKAVEKNDKPKIEQVASLILENHKAEKILEKEWPDHYILLNYYKLSEKIKNVRASVGSASAPITTADVITPGRSTGKVTNKDFSRRKNLPNRIAVRQRRNISNQETTRRSPNQTRESNQDRIKRRR